MISKGSRGSLFCTNIPGGAHTWKVILSLSLSLYGTHISRLLALSTDGIVLLTPLITNNRSSESGNEKVADIDYGKVMLATLPELPGVFLAAGLLAAADRIPSLGASFLFTGSFFLALLAYRVVTWGVTLVILSGMLFSLSLCLSLSSLLWY
eukprot:TRINITY_DN1462_c0_g1_i19.p1 TRINITY_DN1462_c0_g1~~TRINITY_DN1462_c0_g1_i19.p1  ORF type:complete len:152 (-),score=29.48 TRINITY_DN1462_c0_g1_i19:1176-1631(-)